MLFEFLLFVFNDYFMPHQELTFFEIVVDLLLFFFFFFSVSSNFSFKNIAPLIELLSTGYKGSE